MSESYRALIGRPSVRPLLVAISTAFLSFGMIGLALILVTHRATGSFGVAGVVMAAFSVGASVFAPARGRLIDRRGIRPWLVAFAGGYGVSLVLFVVLANGGSVPGRSWSAPLVPGRARLRSSLQAAVCGGRSSIRRSYAARIR